MAEKKKNRGALDDSNRLIPEFTSADINKAKKTDAKKTKKK